MFIRECGGHDLYGLLQLFHLRAPPSAHHAGHLRQDLHGGAVATASDRARERNGQRPGSSPAAPGASTARDPCRQVPVYHRGPLRSLLAARSRHQLSDSFYQAGQALVRHGRCYHSLARQLCRQPHHLCLPNTGVQAYIPENPISSYSLPTRRTVSEL